MILFTSFNKKPETSALRIVFSIIFAAKQHLSVPSKEGKDRLKMYQKCTK